MPRLLSEVEQVLRQAADELVLPRFAKLTPTDIHHKKGDELVTVVDQDVERYLNRSLAQALPGSRVIGEEACAGHPELLRGLAGEWVWLVDPIDGTRNFAQGRPPFAIMVALLGRGELVASWLLDPLSGRMCVAELGAGAWVNGQRVQPQRAAPLAEAEGIVSRAFLPAAQDQLPELLAAHVRQVVPTQRCAGHEYPQVALGHLHFALYWRTLPWDHAAGTLFLRESGGSVTQLDGTDYRPTAPRPGLLLAGSPALGRELLELMASSGHR